MYMIVMSLQPLSSTNNSMPAHYCYGDAYGLILYIMAHYEDEYNNRTEWCVSLYMYCSAQVYA